MEQSAVKWLFDNLLECPKDKFVWYSYLDKALEMEKQINSEKPNLSENPECSQAEISDEEIKKIMRSYNITDFGQMSAYVVGAKWVIEKLKYKGNGNK